MINYWTSREDKIITEEYPAAGTAIITKLPGRSKDALMKRAQNLGIKTVMSGKGQCGKIPWNKGSKKFYVCVGCNQKTTNKKYCTNDCYHRHRIVWNKGLTIEDLRVYNYSMKQREAVRGKPAWNKGLTKETDERVAKYANTHREQWKNSEYARRRGQEFGIQPNKWELQLLDILQEFDNTFEFIGDGRTQQIAGKWPDFINGDNKLVEFFGEYWHKYQEESERIEHFKKNGYDCLIIWGRDMKNLNTLQIKIGGFLRSTK